MVLCLVVTAVVLGGSTLNSEGDSRGGPASRGGRGARGGRDCTASLLKHDGPKPLYGNIFAVAQSFRTSFTPSPSVPVSVSICRRLSTLF